MLIAVLIVNLIASFASAGAAVVALRRPGSLSGSTQVQDGETFYVRMYAARAMPFGLTAGLLPFWTRGEAIIWLLLTASCIQSLDIIIAIGNRNRGMATGASVGTILHLVCAFAIWNGPRSL